jgi:hypothetical protein
MQSKEHGMKKLSILEASVGLFSSQEVTFNANQATLNSKKARGGRAGAR